MTETSLGGRLSVALLAAATGALAACSLLVSTDDLVGGGGGADAASDGGALDGVPPLDATPGADANDGEVEGPHDGATDGGTSPCGVSHTFCEDFDSTLVLGVPWTSVDTAGNATAAIDTSQGRSPPHSALLSLPSYAIGSSPHAVLIYDTHATASMVDFAFDAFLDESPAANVNLASIEVTTGSVRHDYLFVATPTIDLQEQTSTGGTVAVYPLGYPAPIKAWHHFKLHLDLIARTMTATVDAGTQTSNLSSSAQVGTVAIHAGCFYVAPNAGPVGLHIDNVALDIQ